MNRWMAIVVSALVAPAFSGNASDQVIIRKVKDDLRGWRECHKVCVRQERMESHAFNTREEDVVRASLL